MSRAIRHPSLQREIVFALMASLVGATTVAALGLVVPAGIATRIAATGLGGACLLRALGRSSRHSGGLTTIMLFVTCMTLAWLLAPTLTAFVAVELAVLWLTRLLVLRPGLGGAALELGLIAAGATGAAWAAVRTSNFGLAAWCLLLAFALTACLPVGGPRRRIAGRTDADGNAFGRALQSADSALARLAACRD